MTDAERKLWSRLRNNQLGFHFRRQVPVGTFVVDFISIKAKLVIEVDGSQHQTDEGIRSDARRDDELLAQGLRVLRFSNYDVLHNTDLVLEQIWSYIHKLQN
jgi:very-short-patch-repair endonuclease